MDSRQLRNFLVVYDTHSLHVAAERLYLSQQGLSKSIRTLEAELGITLFERTHSGMLPTAAGEHFHDFAVATSRDLHRLRDDLHVIASGQRELVVPCSYGTLHRSLGLFERFQALHPEVRVRWMDLSDRQAEQAVLEGRGELGLLTRSATASELDFEPLWSCGQVLLVYEGHKLYDAKSIDYCDLRGQPLAFEGADFNVNANLVRNCLDAGFSPDIAAETSDITLCLRLAATHECLAVVPAFIAQEWPHEGLRAIPFADSTYTWEMGIGWPRGNNPQGDAAELASFLVQNRHELGLNVPRDSRL